MNNFTKYTILLAATSLCTFNAANAVEKGKFYASGSYGVGFADKFDYKDEGLAVKKPSNANVFGAAIGYGVTDNIRAELGYNGFYGMKYKFEDNDLVTHSQKVSADALFASAYYDISKFDKIKPYVAAGVGIANVKAGDFTTSNSAETNIDYKKQSKKQFAWQLGTGVNYIVNDKIDLNLVNYRYSNLGKSVATATSEDQSDAGDTATVKLKVHSISTGITFKF
jgi:opacity protein-like surface antigen